MALRVEVALLSGKSCEVELEAESTVSHLKLAISEGEWALPPEVQSITTADGLKFLDDDSQVEDRHYKVVVRLDALVQRLVEHGGNEARQTAAALRRAADFCGRRAVAAALLAHGLDRWTAAVLRKFEARKIGDWARVQECTGYQGGPEDPEAATAYLNFKKSGHGGNSFWSQTPAVNAYVQNASIDDPETFLIILECLELIGRELEFADLSLEGNEALKGHSTVGWLKGYAARCVYYNEQDLIRPAVLERFARGGAGVRAAFLPALEAMRAKGVSMPADFSQVVAEHLQAIRQTSPAVPLDALGLLARIAPRGDRAAVAVVLPLLEDGRPDVRMAALAALGALAARGDGEAVAAILASDPGGDFQDVVLGALADVAAPGDPRAVAAAAAHLGDRRPALRQSAVEALDRLALPGDREVAAGLARCLEDPKPWIRTAAREAIDKLEVQVEQS